MIFLGLGEVLGAFFIGYIVDHFGSKISVFVNLLFINI